jgi:CRISPR-associated endoribonuclease Cas6
MRTKISLIKVQGNAGLVPLHHQQIVSAFMEDMIREAGQTTERYIFSSLKGTSKVQNGQIRFLSNKVTLVIGSSDRDFLNKINEKIAEKKNHNIGKLSVMAKALEEIPDPDFKTVMKYVCISPIIPAPAVEDGSPEPMALDPMSHEFSDMLYSVVIDNMEKAGFSEADLNSFAEFEVTPDVNYVNKLNEGGKKFARIYKNNQNKLMMGYLLPFTMHAHPTVHKFIWESGLGLYGTHGYGMIDIVQPEGRKKSRRHQGNRPRRR